MNRDELERAIALTEEELGLLYGNANLTDAETVKAHETALAVLRAELSRESQTCEGRSDELNRAITMLENQDVTLSIPDIAAVQFTVKLLRKMTEDEKRSCVGCVNEEFLTLLKTPLETCLYCTRYEKRTDRYEPKGEANGNA